VLTEAFEWQDAERELRRATALGPNNAELFFRLGFMLFTTGRVHEAIAAFDQARALDPFYSMAAAYSAWSMGLAGRNEEATAEARRSLELDPTNEAIANTYDGTLLETGHAAEAVAFAQKMAPKTTDIRRLGFYGLVLARGGATDDARAILRRVDALPDGTWGKLSAQTRLDLALGDTARALTAMERAAAGDGDLVLAAILSSRHFDAVRKSPRFAAILRKFNLDVARLTAPDGGRSR